MAWQLRANRQSPAAAILFICVVLFLRSNGQLHPSNRSLLRQDSLICRTRRAVLFHPPCSILLDLCNRSRVIFSANALPVSDHRDALRARNLSHEREIMRIAYLALFLTTLTAAAQTNGGAPPAAAPANPERMPMVGLNEKEDVSVDRFIGHPTDN